jgi:hypothetical protein
VKDLDQVEAGFIASESFALAPIRSIDWGVKRMEFDLSKSKDVIERIEKFMV